MSDECAAAEGPAAPPRRGVALTVFWKFVTLAVFHFERSPLKLLFPSKRSFMSSIRDTSHPEIAPCVASAFDASEM